MMWDWGPWWHGLPMMAFWLVTLVAIVWAVTRLFPAGQSDDARQVLDGRLARGELDVDEYRRLRDELEART